MVVFAARLGGLPQLQQVAAVDHHLVGDLGQQLRPQSAFGQQAPQRACVAGHVSASFGGVQVAAVGGGFQHEAAQRHGFLDAIGKAFLAVFADVAVGVVLARQEQKFDSAHVGGKGQGGVQGLAGRAPPGVVAVKAEHHRFGEAKQLLHMLGRAGGAQRGHRVGKPQLRQRHHVHVALGDQRVAVFAQGGAGLEQAVQLTAFAEHRGFRGVEVFGLFIPQHPPTKADAFALDVADREHHTVAEAVIALGFTLGVFFAWLTGDDQPAFHQQRVVVVRKHAGQRAPAFGGVPQTKGFGDFTR